jgi:hypothetical protein
MRIQHAFIKNYKPLEFSGYKSIEIIPTSDIWLIVADNGAGKLQPLYSKIKIPGGWTTMGEIQIGDIVTAWDGTPSKVIKVYPHGLQDIYELIFSDGRTVHAGIDHLWKVYYRSQRLNTRDQMVSEIMTTGQLFLHQFNMRHEKYIDLCISEQISDVELPIHPYLLGVLIGDEYLPPSSIKITTDDVIIDRIKTLLPENMTLWISKYITEYTAIASLIKTKDVTRNPLIAELRKLGLLDKRSGEKFIPQIYLHASTEQRVELLKGLMDTDGYCGTNNRISFSTSSDQLAKDVQYLVWSLGGKSSISTTIRTYNYINVKGEHYSKKSLLHKVGIKLQNPKDCFFLPRKQNNAPLTGTHENRNRLRILGVRKLLKQEECKCIRIDHPDQLYITDNFVVTHNSSLLRALSPLPAKKAIYHKRGVKELEIVHNGHNYILRSDFTDKDHIHSFVKDDVELNVSGLSTIQEDLVSRELGFTALTHELMFNRIHFSNMSKNERKNHVLNINPFDLSYFLDLHKKISSKIRECKNNIKMLHTRQGEMESKMANKSILESKTLEKNKLVELKTILDKVIFTINQYINQFESSLNNIEKSNVSLEEVKIKGHEIQNFLLRTIGIPKEIEVSESEIARLQDEIKTIEEQQLWHLIKEIESYDEQLSELKSSTTLSGTELEKKIKEYQKELISLEPKDRLPCLQEDMNIEDFKEFITMLTPSIVSLKGHIVPKFIPMEKEYRVSNLIRILESSISGHTNLFKDIQNKQLQLKQELNESLSPPQDQTGCDRCELFKVNAQKTNLLNKERKELLKRLTQIEKRISYLETRLQLIRDYGTTYITPSRIYRDITTKIRQLRLFEESWITTTLTDTLLHQPNKVINILETVLLNTVNKNKKQQLEKELIELISTLDKIKHTSKTTKEFLEKILDDKYNQRRTLMAKIRNYTSQLNNLQYLLSIKEERQKHIQDLTYLQKELSLKEQRAQIVATIKYYKKMEEACILVQQSIDQDLRTLDVFLTEQNSLLDRYTKEIVPLLQQAEHEKELHEDLELALSPTSGIPHKYLVKSLNNYITTVNALINQVWCYPLVIQPVSETEELTFVFPIKVDDVLVPDIAECSTGQRCMIDFAWNIAGIMGRKLQDYPLYLDEADDGLDVTHKQRFLELLKALIDNKIISQLLMVNHHALMSEGFSDSDVICLRDENIVVPEHANRHVKFT